MTILTRIIAALYILTPLATSFSPSFLQHSTRYSSFKSVTLLKAGPKDDIPTTSSSTSAATGPKSESSSRRSSSTSRRTSRPHPSDRTTTQRRRTEPTKIKRAPHQFDHTKEEARPFIDTLSELSTQPSNEDSDPYSLPSSLPGVDGEVIAHEHIQTTSLDELFPDLKFSNKFATSKSFREELRGAMREDIFDTTPAYSGMSEKARRMLLLPDSSLQGSWKCENGGWIPAAITQTEEEKEDKEKKKNGLRMKKLTQVLKDNLGSKAPTGDEFMDTIGTLCGSKPSTHWIDIVGVLDRRIPHSWHQDTGNSRNGDTYTVLFGFPAENDYDGIGVFSHVLKLKKERWAEEGHAPNEPVLFGRMEDMEQEKYVVRPRFQEGKEFILYRDVDVLHSSPDVAYRASVMRFM